MTDEELQIIRDWVEARRQREKTTGIREVALGHVFVLLAEVDRLRGLLGEIREGAERTEDAGGFVLDLQSRLCSYAPTKPGTSA